VASAHSCTCAAAADGAGEGSGVDSVVTVASGVELIVPEGGVADGVPAAGGVLVVVVDVCSPGVVVSGVVAAGSESAAGAGVGVGSGSAAAGAGAGVG
jgi:hypothetical protein